MPVPACRIRQAPVGNQGQITGLRRQHFHPEPGRDLVRTGAKPADAAVNVGLDVTKKLRVQGETRMDGHTSVGVGVEWEY